MINKEKLKIILDGYKTYFPSHFEDEKYKWEAIKHFQDHWDIDAECFGDMFKEAIDKTYNLLASGYAYPREMIKNFAKADDEATRQMFRNLYDESRDLAERVEAFKNAAEEIRMKYDDGTWRNHYQNTNAISTYLWLRYPDKYYIYNSNGNKRRVFQNFLDAKVGDMVIGYESVPVKKVVALGRITQANDGKAIYFEKTEGLINPVEYQTLRDCSEMDKMEFFVQPNGSLFTLTKGEFNFIMDIIRETNPLKEPDAIIPKYTKEDFLSAVYMSEEKYDVLEAVLRNKLNIILEGAPGVGKTFSAKRLAYAMMGEKDDSRIEIVQFHQNYSYEDFVQGYRPSGAEFKLADGIFYRFCQTAANDPDKPYFFIIDEINRGNLSKIFGELLMLIDREYRDTKITLAYSGMPFSVPKNLYIIGMMNTADRSLAMIDYALRRRFSFFKMEPGFGTEGFIAYQKSFANETFDALIDQIKALNREISEDKSLGRGFCIGHSYFCGQKPGECTTNWMRSVVEFDIIPTLSEYWFDEQAKLDRWEKNLRGVFDDE